MRTTPRQAEPRFLIYALGGGWGHLTRAAALANALPAGETFILTNSAYADIVQGSGPPLQQVLPEEARTIVAGFRGTVIVDAFPRGLMGELCDVLPSLGQPKILVHRDLKPEYVEWAGLRKFVVQNYDAVFCPGEDGPLADLPQARKTSPWIVRQPWPIEDVNVVVCASGNAEELAWFGEAAAALAPHTSLRVVAPELPPGCPKELWVRYWPAIDWISGARAVIGGAGYNTVYECAACGIPLVARAWPRKYDRQHFRARRAGVTVVETPLEAAALAVELARTRPQPIPFRNGAIAAAQQICSNEIRRGCVLA